MCQIIISRINRRSQHIRGCRISQLLYGILKFDYATVFFGSKTGVVLPETTKESTDEESSATPEVTKPAEQKKTSSMKTIMTTILLLALGAVGAYYYFKIYKPGRPKEDDGENQGMEQEDFPYEEEDPKDE